MTIFKIIAGIFLILFSTTTIEAEELDMAEPYLYKLIVGQTIEGGMEFRDTLSIHLKADSVGVGGFNLKFALVSDYLKIDKVLPGDICDSCRWDFFNARMKEVPLENGLKLDVWEVVAMADMVPDSIKPLCYGFSMVGSIVDLVITHEQMQIPNSTSHVVFYWEDCTDNTISALDGNRLLLGRNILHYMQSEKLFGQPFDKHLYPDSDECINPKAKNVPTKQIDFYNGGIIFSAGFELE